MRYIVDGKRVFRLFSDGSTSLWADCPTSSQAAWIAQGMAAYEGHFLVPSSADRSGGDGMAERKSDPRREQLERNYAAFMKRLPELVKDHAGKFALMRDGDVVDYYDTPRDAATAGEKLYPDLLFSIQEVTERPVDLGFFSHALPQRPV